MNCPAGRLAQAASAGHGRQGKARGGARWTTPQASVGHLWSPAHRFLGSWVLEEDCADLICAKTSSARDGHFLTLGDPKHASCWVCSGLVCLRIDLQRALCSKCAVGILPQGPFLETANRGIRRSQTVCQIHSLKGPQLEFGWAKKHAAGHASANTEVSPLPQ